MIDYEIVCAKLCLQLHVRLSLSAQKHSATIADIFVIFWIQWYPGEGMWPIVIQVNELRGPWDASKMEILLFFAPCWSKLIHAAYFVWCCYHLLFQVISLVFCLFRSDVHDCMLLQVIAPLWCLLNACPAVCVWLCVHGFASAMLSSFDHIWIYLIYCSLLVSICSCCCCCCSVNGAVRQLIHRYN